MKEGPSGSVIGSLIPSHRKLLCPNEAEDWIANEAERWLEDKR
jgi:hypothetical protein